MSAGTKKIEITAVGSDRIFTQAESLPPPSATYTVSARSKSPQVPVFAYLRNNYGNVPLLEIDSLFGFVERSSLYGGRVFVRRELSERDVHQLNNAGIGVRLPMTNHYVERDEYLENKRLFKKYHRTGNSVICTNDELAQWIRDDFPDYRLDASVIKNVKSLDKLEQAMELYDSVVLPMSMNEDLDFLESIADKDKVTLFANAGCALTCPSKICYVSMSKANKGEEPGPMCSQELKSREMHGMVDFPLEPYVRLGFHRFKLLRARPGAVTGF